jgi:hypothetical protein
LQGVPQQRDKNDPPKKVNPSRGGGAKPTGPVKDGRAAGELKEDFMKVLKVSLILIAVALFSIGLSSTSYAFHSGGVAECEGCHTMHNSFEGVKMTVNGLAVGTTNAYLLKGSDSSSTCLNCHSVEISQAHRDQDSEGRETAGFGRPDPSPGEESPKGGVATGDNP